MADGMDTIAPSAAPEKERTAEARKTRSPLTRRDFLIKANAGAVAVGLATGVGFASPLAPSPAPDPSSTAPPAAGTTPHPASATRVAAVPVKATSLSRRRVTLNIDGRNYEVDVDVRESLWETMNYQLGLSNANLGCDRGECGACAVLVDGRPVNSCSMLSARLGHGQKILTVGGITHGTGPDGLHAVQRALWLEGGFQCGLCTRGFVMAAYALLQKNRNPSDEQIRQALAGNICRCGEYPKIISAVKKAAAELRGERVTYAAPLLAAATLAVASTPAGASASRQFEFAIALSTIELMDSYASDLKQRPGVLDVSGSERTITVVWDSTKLDEARVRQLLADTGHAVKP